MTFEELFDKYEGEVEATREAPTGATRPLERTEGTEGGTGSTLDDIGPAKLAEFFGLNTEEIGGAKSKLREIWEYARRQGEDAVNFLSRLEGRIGDSKYGVSKLEHFYQYIKLSGQAEGLLERLRGYGNTGSSDRQRGDSGENTAENGGRGDDGGGESGGSDGGAD